MNETLFNELYVQAAGKEWRYDFDPGVAKIFAELVVQESIRVLTESTDRHRKEYFADLLRQHYGVE